MLLSILDLEKVTVDDVMVPHNEIHGIDLDNDDDEIEQSHSGSQHTRLPVYRDSIDKVVGVLHLRKLANLAKTELTKSHCSQALTEPLFCTGGHPLSTQLVQFQRRRERIAMVVDEYGDIQGIVTLEDILEEIVGEFTTDPADAYEDVVSEGSDTFLVDATANIAN